MSTSSRVCIPNIKAPAQRGFEIPCYTGVNLIFEKGHNSENKNLLEKKKILVNYFSN